MKNEVEVLKRLTQLEREAERIGLTMVFSGEEFLLRKMDSQLWAKCDNFGEVAQAIASYAHMCRYGSALPTSGRGSPTLSR